MEKYRYAYMLIYHQRPSLSASLDRIQKISEIDSIYLLIYLFIYLFIEKEKIFGINYTL